MLHVVSTYSPCLPANKADFWNVDISPTFQKSALFAGKHGLYVPKSYKDQDI